MKQERKEELLVRWMDDELGEAEMAELEALLESEPELRTMRDGHEKLCAGLREVYPEVEDLPYGDFFQSRLKRAIEEAERQPVETAGPASSWKELFRWWMAPLSAGALALAFLAGTRVSPESGGAVVAAHDHEEKMSLVYTPEGGVTANFVEDGEASAIVLEGLQDIPDSTDLMAMANGAGGDWPVRGVQMVSAKGTVFR